MNRSFCAGCAVVAFLLARTSLAYDAFNNFGPGDTYDTSTAYPATMGAYPPFIPRISGSRFTSAASGHLAVIRIALHNVFHSPPGVNLVDVRLHAADAGGNLGPVLASFTRSGLPTFGGSEPPETLVNSEDVDLVAGNQYWIVVAPGDTTTDAVWNWSLDGAGDRFATSTNFGASYSYFESRRGAMRIELVPEPAVLVTALFACIVAALMRHRRSQV